jgi:hypothetical protein
VLPLGIREQAGVAQVPPAFVVDDGGLDVEMAGERGERGADVTPLRRGVQALQGGGDRPVGDHAAEEPGCLGVGEPGAGQEQGCREGGASHPGGLLLPRQEPGGPGGPEGGRDGVPARKREDPGRVEADGGRGAAAR